MRDGKKMAEALESFINGANEYEIDDFANGFIKMHNTLEQKAVGMLIKTLQKVSESTQVDARNEACVKASKLMIKGYKSELIKDLMESDSYWTEDRASNWVNGGDYDISKMPLI